MKKSSARSGPLDNRASLFSGLFPASEARTGLAMLWLGTSLFMACAGESPAGASGDLSKPCPFIGFTDPRLVPDCLYQDHHISAGDRDSARALIAAARSKADSYRFGVGGADYPKGVSIARSLGLMTEYYSRNLLADSARLHRTMDIIAVAMEVAASHTPFDSGKVRPLATPYLVWYTYPGVGTYFQPVTTAQTVAHLLPRASAPTDTLLAIAGQLSRYAVWREQGGHRFPVWEYEFPWTSGGITVQAPVDFRNGPGTGHGDLRRILSTNVSSHLEGQGVRGAPIVQGQLSRRRSSSMIASSSEQKRSDDITITARRVEECNCASGLRSP